MRIVKVLIELLELIFPLGMKPRINNNMVNMIRVRRFFIKRFIITNV